jgi:hypothetical protein
MGTTIRARFLHGVLEPLDRLISTRPEPRL